MVLGNKMVYWSRVGVVVKVHQGVLSSPPRMRVTCGLTLLVLYPTRKWKNEDAKIPVTPRFVLGTHQTVYRDRDTYCLMSA